MCDILIPENQGVWHRLIHHHHPLPIAPKQNLRTPAAELEKEEVLEMTGSYPEEKMQTHTISKLITSRQEDSNVKEVQEEFEYPELGVLG